MPQFRADFDVKSTLVLPRGSEPLVLAGDSPKFRITIRNATEDSSGHVPALDVQVVSSSESIETAPSAFRSLLAEQLDILSFATNCAFLIEQCSRVIEWEPHQKTRAFKAFQKFDPLYPPDPVLDAQSIRTAQILSDAEPEGFVRSALRDFRLGIVAAQLDDQFQHFWLAIETIAEGSKDTVRIPIPCPVCNDPLICGHCNDTPLRRPMARQAIKKLIGKIVKDNPEAAYRRLVTVRDQLMHGRSFHSIEAEGQPLSEIVNEVGTIAWNAIFLSMNKIKENLSFGFRTGGFAGKELVVGAIGRFEHLQDTEHPDEDRVPKVRVDRIVRFGGKPNQSSNDG
jgi:hypothetical protein